MKILKILLLAIIVGVGIYVIHFIDPDPVPDPNIDPTSPNVLSNFNTKYENEWKSTKEWDVKLLNSQRDTAAKYCNEGSINKEQYNTLLQNISNDALSRVVELLETEFKKSKIDEERVKHNMDGIRFLKEKKEATDTDLIKKMENVYDFYNSLKQFAAMKYSANQFNLGLSRNCTNWINFDYYITAEKNKRVGYKNNNIYKEYFSNNTLINNGLNDVESKMSNIKTNYYKKLYKQIDNNYSTLISEYKKHYDRQFNLCSSDEEWDKMHEKFNEDGTLLNRNLVGTISSNFRIQTNNDKILNKEMEDIVKKHKKTIQTIIKNQKPSFK
jgi:hypothetical protein